MKPKLFLHAGMPKTASRTIQQALAEFDDGHLRYLRVGPANHSTLTQALSLPPEKLMQDFPQRVPDRGAATAQRHHLTQKVDAELKLGRAAYILSSEHLFHLPQDLFFGKLVPFLEDRFGEIEMICYLRPPKSYIQSAFQQKVKTGLSRFQLENPNYELKLKKFLETGWRLTFRPYQNTDILADFTNLVGAQLPVKEWPSENLSLSAHATALLFKFNATGVLPDALLHLREDRGALVQRIARIGPPHPLRLDESLMTINPDDLAWVLTQTGIDLSEPDAQGLSSVDEIMALAEEANWLLAQTETDP